MQRSSVCEICLSQPSEERMPWAIATRPMPGVLVEAALAAARVDLQPAIGPGHRQRSIAGPRLDVRGRRELRQPGVVARDPPVGVRLLGRLRDQMFEDAARPPGSRSARSCSRAFTQAARSDILAREAGVPEDGGPRAERRARAHRGQLRVRAPTPGSRRIAAGGSAPARRRPTAAEQQRRDLDRSAPGGSPNHAFLPPATHPCRRGSARPCRTGAGQRPHTG